MPASDSAQGAEWPVDRRIIIAVGIIAGAGLLGAIFMEMGLDIVGEALVLPAALTIINPLFWIIVAIVFMVRRRGQQQQQQVVVINGDQAHVAGPRLRCPQCSGLSRADARFCGHCGRALG